MKTKQVEKVITAHKYRIGHPLKRHLTEISTCVNNLNKFYVINVHKNMVIVFELFIIRDETTLLRLRFPILVIKYV